MNKELNGAEKARTNVIETLLDLPVHLTDYQGSIVKVIEWVEMKHRPAAFIVQSNVQSLVTAQEHATYRETLFIADLSVPDGMPLVWLLRLKGKQIKHRVYGPDLMLMLCEQAAKRSWRCFLYGGKPDVLELLRLKLLARFPSLNIVGSYSPPFRDLTPREDEEVCAMISSAKPDILWVGLGSPKQDIWMYDHRDKLDVSVMHGVGAAFDFLSGQVKQAPRWMMNVGLEWIFRLSQEPRRLWKRYTFTNLKFVYYLVRKELFRSK